MKKMCELCSHTARLFCDSDQASLCYDCDRRIHSANFLVAKHSRTLLCHTCHSPTPWVTSGLKLGRAASVCVDCLRQNDAGRRTDGCVSHDDLYEEGDGETEDHEGESAGRDEFQEDDGENQVVPWPSAVSPPPTSASSSTNEEFSSSRFESGGLNFTVKRKRLESDDATSSTSLRTLKVIRSDRVGDNHD